MSGLAITLILCVLIGFTCFCGILSVENDRWKTKEKLAEEKRIGLGYIERERKTQEFMQEKIKIVSEIEKKKRLLIEDHINKEMIDEAWRNSVEADPRYLPDPSTVIVLPPSMTKDSIDKFKEEWQTSLMTGIPSRQPITSGFVVPYSGYAISGSCAPVGFRPIYHVGGDAIYSAELIPDSAAYRYTVPNKKKSTDKVCEHCGSGNSKSRFSCSQCGAPLPLALNE